MTGYTSLTWTLVRGCTGSLKASLTSAWCHLVASAQDGRLLAWGSCRQANEKGSILCDWLGGPIWFSLVGPELEAGMKTRGTVSYWPPADYTGPFVTEVVAGGGSVTPSKLTFQFLITSQKDLHDML